MRSIGVGSVSAVYLARLGETRDPVRGWRLIQGATLAWGLGWLALALTAGLIAPEVMTWLGFAWATGHDIVRDLFLVLALGIPGVVASGVFGRRLLAQGLAHHLVPVALSSVATGLVAGALLSPRLGLPGLAAGLALSQYVACIHSALVLRREGWNAHPRAG